MKKVVIVLSLVALSMSLVSCGGLLRKVKDKIRAAKDADVTEVVEATAEYVDPNEVRIYANGYDGFVNVRRGPSLKSPVLGQLRNGNDYLVQVGIEGKWIAVDFHGVTGYINSLVVGYTPWKPVYLDIDSSWIQGWYYSGYTSYLIYGHGKYALIQQYGDMEYGVWRLEGTEIVFTAKYVTDYGRNNNSRVGDESRFEVDVPNHTIAGYNRMTLYPDSYYKQFDDEAFSGEMVFSKEDFQSYKKLVNTYVNWK